MEEGSRLLVLGLSSWEVTWPPVSLAGHWGVGRRSGRHGAGRLEGQSRRCTDAERDKVGGWGARWWARQTAGKARRGGWRVL